MTFARLSILVLVVGLPLQPALAAQFCIGDAAALQAALGEAASNGEHDELRLVSGRHAAAKRLTYVGLESFDLSVEGGWNADCTLRRDDPAATAIDGSDSTDGILAWTYVNATAGSLRLRNLSITSASVGQVNAVSLGSYSTGWSGDLEVESVVFRGIAVAGSADYAVALEGGGGRVRVRNCLFVGNRIGRAYREPQRIATRNASASPMAVFSGNTVAGNYAEPGTLGASGALSVQGSGSWQLVNNLLWGNGGADLKSIATLGLVSNDIGVQQVGTLLESRDNLSIDPGFVEGWRLGAGSPLIDLGEPLSADAAGSRDAFGQSRQGGLGLDIGAYEFPRVFADGFEGD